MIQFTNTTLTALKTWRHSYLDSLSKGQDMYSESMISWMSAATCYHINRSNTPIGYFIMNGSGELVEFYICDDLLTQKEIIFQELIEKFEIKNAYCKSFDQVLLSCCLKYSNTSKLVGYLFQDCDIKTNIVLEDSISVRMASLEDVPFLNSFENELLEEGEEIDTYIKNNSVYMFMKGNELIGCGYLFNVITGRKQYDAGMWINQTCRKKGYGTQIISYLMKYCFENDFIPTAGCEESNVASRRTLEKCGFVSKYCLINFEFCPKNYNLLSHS